MYTVEVTNLIKKYKNFNALNGISLKISKGEILGILGPNGAGKTTLIKALVGSIIPSSGKISILGFDPIKEKWKLRRCLGYMPQDASLYENLSPIENILFFGRGAVKEVLKTQIDKILEFTELTARASSPIYTFSGGMKKRVSLACSLINNPSILFLDEPTAAVDPYLKIKSWKLFRELARNGTTIIISTHLMDEAMLCDKLAILREGELLAFDTPQNIIQNGSAEVIIDEGKIIKERVLNTPQELAKKLQEYGLNESIQGISFNPQNLEDIIIAITSKDKL